MGCIYKLTNPLGEVYIGQTVSFNRRMMYYRKLLCKGQPKIYSSLLTFGFDKHEVSILEDCDDRMLNIRERYWVDLYNSFNKGLNSCLPSVREKTERVEDTNWYTIQRGKALFLSYLDLVGTIQFINLTDYICSKKEKVVDLKDLRTKLPQYFEKYMQEYSKGTKIELNVLSTKFTKGNLQSFLTSWSNSVNLFCQNYEPLIPQLMLVKIV